MEYVCDNILLFISTDHKVYLQQVSSEEVPYGITMVKAQDVPDNNVSNRKVCIVDTGYDLSHPDLPKSTTDATISGTAARSLNWFEDGSKLCVFYHLIIQV